MPDPRWMIYGATGYTGQLVAGEAIRRGHRPLLAGRNAAKLAPLAERLGLDYTVFPLDEEATIARRLDGVSLVYHAAGPFTLTAAPMLRACLISGTHYMDITGEINVFEHTFAHDDAARRRGIALISGLGFDVILTDCLAAYVAAKVPGAVELEIAVHAIGRPSSGTARSMLEIIAGGGLVRREGKLIPRRFGTGVRRIRFLRREAPALIVPWGDLSTAYRTTGIPNITTYLAYPLILIRMAQLIAPIGQPLTTLKPLRRLFQQVVGRTARGPAPALLERGRSEAWARVTDASGHAAEAWIETLEAYRFTAVAGVRAVEKLLAAPPVGALSPAQALGADFVLEIEGTRRYDALRE